MYTLDVKLRLILFVHAQVSHLNSESLRLHLQARTNLTMTPIYQNKNKDIGASLDHKSNDACLVEAVSTNMFSLQGFV